MREGMNLTKRMSQCNSDFKKLQEDIAKKERVIRSKQRDVRSGKYLPAVTRSLEEQIKAYEVALQRDREKIDDVEYRSLACQYILWEGEIQKRGTDNLPAPKKLSIFNPLRRFNNKDSVPEGAMEEILDRMIELNLMLKIKARERELIEKEKGQGAIISDEKKQEILDEAIQQTLDETTYEEEKTGVLTDINELRGYRKEEAYDIRVRLEKLAVERGKPRIPYTQELKQPNNDEQER